MSRQATFVASAMVGVLVLAEGASPVATKMPDIGYLLTGYDVLKGNPMPTSGVPVDPGFTSPIFQANYQDGAVTPDGKWMVPTGTSILTAQGCTMSYTSRKMSGAKSYQESLETKVSLSVSGWGASFSASTDYKHVLEGTSEEHSLFTQAEAVCSAYQAKVMIFGGLGPKLHEAFLAALADLPQDYSEDDYMDFIDQYGTHYVSSVIMGSMFGQQSKFTSSAWTRMESSHLNINAVAGFSCWNVSASASYMSDEQKKQAEEFSQESTEQLLYSIGAAPPGDNQPSTWMSQVKDNPVPISLTLRQLDSLLDPSKCGQVIAERLGGAAKTKAVQANMRKALAAYCQILRAQGKVHSCDAPSPDPPFPTLPGLKVVEVSDFSQSYADHGTGSHMDLSMWKPRVGDGQFYAGDACMPNYGQPNYKAYALIIGSDPTALADPVGMHFRWNDRGTGGRNDGGFYTPACPSGYVALGSVGEQFFGDDITSPPPTWWPRLKCVKEEYTERVTFDHLTWADHGSWGHYDGSLFAGIQDTFNGQQLSGPCQGASGYPGSASGYKLKPLSLHIVATVLV